METSEQPELPELESQLEMAENLDQIDALLAGKEIKPEKAPEPEPEGDLESPDEVEAQDESPDEAETPLEIDYDLEVPMPDGRDAMKLGEMKDKLIEVERTRSELDGTRAELLQQQQLMAQYMAQVGEIPEGFKQQAAQQHKQFLEYQHQAMLSAIPEWKDANTFQNDRPRLFEAGKRLGYSKAELSQVADARLVLALKMLADYQDRDVQAAENVKQIKKAAKPKGKKPRRRTNQSELDKIVKQAAASSNEDVKLNAIDELLRS